ncbi:MULTISPECIES: 2-amino-4-hydroxy-6-hydroxymethyldihydropteridine diphosphokinase [unclassified Psychrobacter]|uniref:2-amino-4-hydroxy-6- hydroxymethyldihydropteridine diphosphokinase n=1 Tax=unclassified Psychrobacter TaxID=196806 RepID=UPI00293D330E|nr:2-amino-4-hydroxy-6-hydroxymethyldihydropteridine diphosphokinase [uncultured Psychrobacter sp.]
MAKITDDKWVTAYVGLGSNLTNELGTPMEHLQFAIKSLLAADQIKEVQVSSFYLSAPMGPQDQPDFVNAVAGFETSLPPFELLAFCQGLENNAKRARLRHWGERSLDVDILLYGNALLAEPTLIIPHAGLYERNFVLIPLLELKPTLKVAGVPLINCASSTDWTGLKKLGDN